MSRHLTSRAIDSETDAELNTLRRQLGMHVKPKTSALAAMRQIQTAAERKDSEQANRDKAIELGIITPPAEEVDRILNRVFGPKSKD